MHFAQGFTHGSTVRFSVSVAGSFNLILLMAKLQFF
jgi:hypothetical protein